MGEKDDDKTEKLRLKFEKALFEYFERRLKFVNREICISDPPSHGIRLFYSSTADISLSPPPPPVRPKKTKKKRSKKHSAVDSCPSVSDSSSDDEQKMAMFAAVAVSASDLSISNKMLN